MSSGGSPLSGTIVIGTFSTSALRAQPFGYEGDARNGETATIVQVNGLVRPSEWLAFKAVYDNWRNLRIADQDTLVSQAVGTTVSVTASANGVQWTDKPCWFTEAPSATQVGAFVEVNATLVDAAEALAVFLKQESVVDCERVKADLERQKAEKDCEIAALKANGAQLAADLASQDVELELVNRDAEINAREDQKNQLADLDFRAEVQAKQAQRNKIDDYATTIASLDEDLELSQSNADLAAYTPSKRAALAGNEYDLEILQNTADIAALESRLEALKASRQLRELYDKALSEDLPNFGTEGLGDATIQLLQPPDSRINTPSFELTATGNALITGALKPVKTLEINGILTGGTREDVLDWYDETVSARPAAGSLFPAGPPVFEVESILVAGAKGSRTSVQISVIEIPS
jgi:hypothetical protein